jgi:hypothetical protein
MKTSFPIQIRAAAHALRGRPARVSCALALGALAAACAPLPQAAGYQPYQPYGYRPAASYYPQQPTGYYYQPDDETDRVINTPAPAPAPAPADTKSAELQPQPAPATPAPVAPSSDPGERSSTCGYWRLGCGILWQ